MKLHINTLILSVCLVIISLVLGNAYMKRNNPDATITVTGLGKKDFTSDLIVWDGYFSKEALDLKTAAAALNKERETIENYLIKSGVDKKEMVFSAVNISEVNKSKYSSDGNFVGEEFVGYRLVQTVQVSSKNVEKIEDISRKITDLLTEGIQFYSISPRYYYTQLPDLKIQLISEATEDARIRARKIAEKSGGKIGKLVSSQMGIFQITGQNSDEEYSWGGTFNTSSKEKSVSIPMKLTYKVK